MNQWRHGGDVYRNEITYDFSVNVNPLGIPRSVRDAMLKAVDQCDCYPDGRSEQLRQQLAKRYQVDCSWVTCGNGASELFMAIHQGIKPKTVVIPVPSFYGYEHAMDNESTEVIYYSLKKQDDYRLTEDIIQILTEKVDLLVLASPNNPVGNVIPDDLLRSILDHCKKYNIIVVLDQCFIDFVSVKPSIRMQKEQTRYMLESYPNLILIGAFTKSFAIPGVRLGYMFCSDWELCERIKTKLPEWNVSLIAQYAGVAACSEMEFVQDTVTFIEKEREWLVMQLEQLGFQCLKSDANYVMFYSDKPLYEMLLHKKILIRSCENYRGLSEGYFRVAVRTREEHEILLQALMECE